MVKNLNHYRSKCIVCIVMIAIVMTLLPGISVIATETNIAQQATATASSEYSGYSVNAVKDGVVSGYPADPSKEWASNGQKEGAWVQLTWGTAQSVTSVKLFDRPNSGDQVTSGTLTFSDGTSVSVGALPNNASAPAEITFTAKTVTWVKFMVDTVKATTANIGLAEFEVYAASAPTPTPTPSPTPTPVPTTPSSSNVALQATAAASSVYNGYSASAVKDGVVSGYPADASKEWASNGQKEGAWVQLTWGTAQTVTAVRLFDRPNSGDQVTSGTLTFSDGTSLSVGSLPNNASAPAEITFTAKTVTWVKFTVDTVKATTANIGLAEFEVWTGGGPVTTPTPTSPTPTPSGATPTPTPAGPTPTPIPGGYPQYKVTAIAPELRSNINGNITIKLYAPGMKHVSAACWHQPDAEHTNPVGYDAWFAVGVIPDGNGYAEVSFPANDFPSGPIAVRLMAWDSPPGNSNWTHQDIFYLQLYNTGGVDWETGAPAVPPAQAQGMTLIYEDEFDSPLSISADGQGAQYMSHTPYGGDFGDAYFADYESQYNPFYQVDDFLRIRASKPEGFTDPMGWGREFVSGLISSVDGDGNGVTATLGYFEARILCPAGLGTWPAFWLLSNNRVTEEDPAYTVEIDVLEGYGFRLHNPKSAFHYWDRHGLGGGIHTYDLNDIKAMGLGDTAQKFHVYGAKVTQAEVIYYIDNIEVWRQPNQEPGRGPVVFMINLALGSGWPIELEQYGNAVDMYVDYVRVYQ